AWAPALRVVLFAVVFLLACRLDVLFTSDVATPFRFSAAVLLSALLLSPPSHWWRYLSVILPIHLSAFPGSVFSLCLLFSGFASDCLKSALCAWLLRRLSSRRVWFDSWREFGRYFGVTVILGSVVSASATVVLATPSGCCFWKTWNISFLSE